MYFSELEINHHSPSAGFMSCNEHTVFQITNHTAECCNENICDPPASDIPPWSNRTL